MTRRGSPTDHLGRDWSGSATDIGSQLTAENRSIEVGGDSLIYRRFGNKQTNEPPLVCLQHFRGCESRLPRSLPGAVRRSRQSVPECTVATKTLESSRLDATTNQQREEK